MTDTLLNFDSFGALLKFLRRRAQLTQRDLGLAVGYTEAHVCRLERNQRLPDPTTLTALFVPALQLEDQPAAVARLMTLATQARGQPAPDTRFTVTQVARQQVVEELGVLEDIPAAPTHAVARPQALARLRDALSRERMVALVGLPGMGKTTLAAALARAETAARPVFWLSLTAREANADALLRHLALFVVSMGDESVLGVFHADAAPLPLGRQTALVGGGLARTPALFCLDDAHLLAADERVLETLRVLAGAAHPEARWLLVSREAVPLAEAAHVQLGGLEANEEQTLLERLGARLTSAQAEALRRKTGGSPFLLRLAVGQLLDRGAVPGPFIEHLETLPEAAAYLLDTFLAELAPAAAQLAALLSIFRQPVNVYDELLVELAQAADGPYDLIDAVSALQRRQQIDHPAQAYLHRLLRDHLYTTLVADLPRRRRLHKAAAEWYEHGRADWVEAAYHYAQAGQLVQAAGVLADRGSELFGRGEAAAGVAVVDEIIQRARQRRADSADLRRSLLTTRGDLLVFGPRSVEGEANYREALSLAAQPAVRAALVWRLAQNLIQSGKAAEALALCRATAEDLTPGEGLLRARLATAEGWALLMLARYPEAEVAAGQALALAEPFAGLAPHAVDEVRARSHHVLGVAHSIRGLPDLAVEHWQRTMEAARRAGLRQVENRCLMNIGMVLYQYHDDLAGALRCFNQALEQARALGDTYLMGRLLTNIGLTQHLSNDVEAAQHTLAEAAELRRQMGELPGVANVENMRALVQLALGQVDEARARLVRVMQETEHIGDQRVRSILVDTLAVANMVAGDNAAALAALQREAAHPGLHDDVKMRNELDSHLALALLASGDLAGARALLAAAPAAAGGPECRFERELIAGLAALAGGDLAAARSAAESVAGRAGAIGYKLNEAAARRILAALAAPPPPAEYPRLVWGPTRPAQ